MSRLKNIHKTIWENKNFRKILSFLLALYLILYNIVVSVKNITNNTDNYKEFSMKNDIKSYAGLSQEKLEKTYNKLIKYINTGEENLLDDFNKKEVQHMRDVHGLYNIADFFSNSYIGYIIFIYFFIAKSTKVKRENIKYFTLSWFSLLIIFAIIILLASINFDAAFVKFHEIFFNNDLWLLDPSTDLMIRMLPQEYFMSLAIKIARGSGAMLMLNSIGIAIIYYFISRKIGVKNV